LLAAANIATRKKWRTPRPSSEEMQHNTSHLSPLRPVAREIAATGFLLLGKSGKKHLLRLPEHFDRCCVIPLWLAAGGKQSFLASRCSHANAKVAPLHGLHAAIEAWRLPRTVVRD
jgi:hypothetical protein